MRLLGDRVLLSPLPVQEVSAGGIHLPHGQAGDFKQWWRVEAVGTGKKCSEISVGQTVLTELRTTHETLDDGRKILITDQIIAKIDPEPSIPDV